MKRLLLAVIAGLLIAWATPVAYSQAQGCEPNEVIVTMYKLYLEVKGYVKIVENNITIEELKKSKTEEDPADLLPDHLDPNGLIHRLKTREKACKKIYDETFASYKTKLTPTTPSTTPTKGEKEIKCTKEEIFKIRLENIEKSAQPFYDGTTVYVADLEWAVSSAHSELTEYQLFIKDYLDLEVTIETKKKPGKEFIFKGTINGTNTKVKVEIDKTKKIPKAITIGDKSIDDLTATKSFKSNSLVDITITETKTEEGATQWEICKITKLPLLGFLLKKIPCDKTLKNPITKEGYYVVDRTPQKLKKDETNGTYSFVSPISNSRELFIDITYTDGNNPVVKIRKNGTDGPILDTLKITWE